LQTIGLHLRIFRHQRDKTPSPNYLLPHRELLNSIDCKTKKWWSDLRKLLIETPLSI